MKQKAIRFSDDTSNQLGIFEPVKNDSKAILLIFPAMGVRASYYQKLAETFADRHYTAITADLRGHGHSSERPSRKRSFGYSEIVQYDYPEIVNSVKKNYPDQPVFILGHSLGGQLGALYLSKNPKAIDGLILVACCSVYYKGWPGWGKYRALLGTQFINLIGYTLGYYPGHKMGFGGLEARGVIRDWSRQSRTGKYLVDNSDFDFEAGLKKIDVPVFALSFQGDDFAPKQAVEHLLGKMDQAQKSHLHLVKESARNLGYNHFSWAKKPEGAVDIVAEWIESLG